MSGQIDSQSAAGDTAEREARRREKAEKLVNGSVSTLTLMQREFVIEYLASGNATEAAGKAGYSNPDKAGPRLSKEAKIQAVISDYFFGPEMDVREVIGRYGEQARGAWTEYLRPDGTVDVAQMEADGKKHLINGVKPSKDGPVYDFPDQQTALAQIGRYHGAFTDKTDLTSGGAALQPVIYLPDNGRGSND